MEGTVGTGTSDVAKKHRLRIIFDGVIAVGPPPPEKGKERNGPYFGVMARSTRQLSHRSRRLGETPQYIPMHVPSVYTTLTPFDDGRQPDQVFQLQRGDPKWNIWHPLRERMEFRFDKSGKPRTLTYDDDGVLKRPRKPGQVKVHGIAKVPDARDISPGRTHLLEGLLSPKDDVRQEAAAQILIPWGIVTGGGIFDKENGVEVIFESESGTSTARDVVPNVVISVDVEYVEIAMFSLDTGERLDSLKFQLTEDAEIWVSNGDPSDTAIDLEKLSDEQQGRAAKRDSDIESSERSIEELTDEFQSIFDFKTARSPLRSFVEKVFTSGGGVVPPRIQAIQPGRSTKVDIDFELFNTITGPRRGATASARVNDVPVPVKADGLPFEGPNCLVKQVECDEGLIMKSED